MTVNLNFFVCLFFVSFVFNNLVKNLLECVLIKSFLGGYVLNSR